MDKVEIRVPAEIYSRVSGFYRPVGQWNPGKRSEYNERRKISVDRMNIFLTEAGEAKSG